MSDPAGLSALQSYKSAWRRRWTVLPVFLGVRLLGVALIAPLTGLLALLAIEVSGQPALTDQDILGFLLTPAGFAAGLAAASVLMAGSVIGVAVMTVDLRAETPRGLHGLPRALGHVALRLPALLTYAAILVLRTLVYVAPFGLAAWLGARALLGEYDINYYLSERPPEFLAALAVGGALGATLAALLLRRLLSWALSLHLVLFAGASPRSAFSASEARMAGLRLVLLRRVLGWLAGRAALSAAAGALFGLLVQGAPGLFADDVDLALLSILLIFGLWLATDSLIAAFSLGALSILLNAAFEATGPAPALSDRGEEPRRIGVGVLAGGLVAIAAGAASALVLLEEAEAPDRPVEVIAHRGAAGERPENTLAAFEKAVEDGADWVELDVQESGDGEVVVVHDSDFMKLAGVPTKVWDVTMDELAEIDVGGWFAPEYSDQRTPTLAQALEVVRGTSSRLLIELKYYGHDVALEERTAEIVEAAGMSDRVAAMSLKYPAVQKMRALRPDWRVGVLAATAIGDLARLEADFAAVNASSASPGLARRIDAAGKDLYVWTVNDPLQMTAMISMGVDGLITDEPALAREVIEAREALGAPARLLLLISQRMGLKLPTDAGRDDSP